jgi:hypothetical protein
MTTIAQLVCSAGARGNAIEFISPSLVLFTIVEQKIKSATSAHRAGYKLSGKVLLSVQQYWEFLRKERGWEIFLCQGRASGLRLANSI